MTTDENFAAAEKMEVIVSFARHLVYESRNLEPEYARVVDEKFWDLVCSSERALGSFHPNER